MIGFILYFGSFLLNDGQLTVGFGIMAWCSMKLYIQSFWNLEEYYWNKHKNRDHPLQNYFATINE